MFVNQGAYVCSKSALNRLFTKSVPVRSQRLGLKKGRSPRPPSRIAFKRLFTVLFENSFGNVIDVKALVILARIALMIWLGAVNRKQRERKCVCVSR